MRALKLVSFLIVVFTRFSSLLPHSKAFSDIQVHVLALIMADGPRRRSTRLQKMKEEEPKAAPAKRPPRAQLITTTTKKPRVPKKPAVGTLATVPEVPSAEDEAATDELLPDLLPELAVPHEWKQLLGGDEPSPQPAASTQASASASKKVRSCCFTLFPHLTFIESDQVETKTRQSRRWKLRLRLVGSRRCARRAQSG